MPEWLKNLLGVCEPPVDYQERSATEDEFDKIVEQTQRVIHLGDLQLVRSSKAVTSWCDLYGRRVDEL